jgi:hypothetical protein
MAARYPTPGHLQSLCFWFNAACLAEIRLAAMESDLSRRNQLKADESG